MDKIRKEEISDGLKSTLPDIFFIFLPLIVIFLVTAIRNDPLGVFNQAEWSFAAAVLSGQSIVKVVFAISNSGSTIVRKSRNIAIMIAATIVFFLVPSLIVLFFMLTADPRPLILLVVQIVLFIFSLVIYILFGVISESTPKSEKSVAGQ